MATVQEVIDWLVEWRDTVRGTVDGRKAVVRVYEGEREALRVEWDGKTEAVLLLDPDAALYGTGALYEIAREVTEQEFGEGAWKDPRKP